MCLACTVRSWTAKGYIYFHFSLKGTTRNKSITNLQFTHSEEHHPQVEEVLTCLLTDLSAEGRRIRRGQCTLESGLVCPCIEALLISESDCAMLGFVVRVGVLLQCTCSLWHRHVWVLAVVVRSIHICTYCFASCTWVEQLSCIALIPLCIAVFFLF